MNILRIIVCVRNFISDQRGDGPIQMTLLVGGVALAVSVLAAPLLDSASKRFASSGAYGVDQILTGSINKKRRYTVRKSVLEPGEIRICQDGSYGQCN